MTIPDEIFELAKKGGYKIGGTYQIALDPDFWCALGKSLGWDNETEYYNDFSTTKYTYVGVKAHEFYDLLLTHQDPTEFWQNIIQSKK